MYGPVEAGTAVAGCKVTPLVISAETIRGVDKLAGDAGGLVTVQAS